MYWDPTFHLDLDPELDPHKNQKSYNFKRKSVARFFQTFLKLNILIVKNERIKSEPYKKPYKNERIKNERIKN